MHVFLGLGSNVGDREKHLEEALGRLDRRGFVAVRRSALYLTEPVDAPPQEWFLNGTAGGTTTLTPEDLLEACLAVESELGRVREIHHGPRTVDIDVLLFGEEVRRTPRLTLPHPHMHKRRFVLEPLAEIAAGVRHPTLGRTVAELLRDCPDRSAVARHRPPEAWR